MFHCSDECGFYYSFLIGQNTVQSWCVEFKTVNNRDYFITKSNCIYGKAVLEITHFLQYF